MRYRNPQTGAERESTTRLDYPWEALDPGVDSDAESEDHVEQTTDADIAPGVAETEDLTIPGEDA